MSWRIRHLWTAAPIAVLLVLVLAGSALATSWAAKKSLTTNGSTFTGSHSLVTLDSSNAVAIFENGPNVWVRRTTNSGASWKPRMRLSSNTSEPWFAAISGWGTDVDAVWSEDYPGAHTSILQYRQSTDSGATFAPAVPLASGSQARVTAPDVAHGPNGVVAVAWHVFGANTIRVRVSTNNGISFAPAQTLATISSNYFRPPSVAVGNGVIYVGYFSDDTHSACAAPSTTAHMEARRGHRQRRVDGRRHLRPERGRQWIARLRGVHSGQFDTDLDQIPAHDHQRCDVVVPDQSVDAGRRQERHSLRVLGARPRARHLRTVRLQLQPRNDQVRTDH